MIQGSKEAEIFKLLQDKIDIIRKQLGSMADVLGVLDRIALDDLMLRALDTSAGPQEVDSIAEDALQQMDRMAQQNCATRSFCPAAVSLRGKILMMLKPPLPIPSKPFPHIRMYSVLWKPFSEFSAIPGTANATGASCLPPATTGCISLLRLPLFKTAHCPNAAGRPLTGGLPQSGGVAATSRSFWPSGIRCWNARSTIAA